MTAESMRRAYASGMRRAYASGMRRAYAEQNRTEQSTNEQSSVTLEMNLAFSDARGGGRDA